MTDNEQFFLEVKSILAEYEQNARLTGENFNIFEVLGLKTNEVRHSAFLAELLNIQGSHAQGSKYLDLFIEQLNLNDMGFDAKSSKTFTEYHIGEIDDENKTGGYIDILIRDKENRCIVIENKINASDQPYQLKRYHNFLKTSPKGKLYYLKLFGNKPSPESFDDLNEEEDYSIITYQSDMLPWLERCLKESENIPTMKKIIQQYINIIKNLTRKLQPMDNELVQLITESSKNMEVASNIVKYFDDAKQIILNNFWQTLCEKLKPEKTDDYETYYGNKKDIIRLWVDISEIKDKRKLCWGAAIDDSFFTGFYICDNAHNKLTVENEFTNIVNYLTKRGYTKESDVLGWKHSFPLLNFKEFNSPEIFALADEKYLEEVVEKIVEDASKDINEIRDMGKPKTK